MATTAIDEAKLEAFMGQAVADMGAIISAPLFVIGERLGLYKAMAHAGPLTSQEVADRAGVAERSVREWLRNQAAGDTSTTTPRRTATRFPTSRRWRSPRRTARLHPRHLRLDRVALRR